MRDNENSTWNRNAKNNKKTKQMKNIAREGETEAIVKE